MFSLRLVILMVGSVAFQNLRTSAWTVQLSHHGRHRRHVVPRGQIPTSRPTTALRLATEWRSHEAEIHDDKPRVVQTSAQNASAATSPRAWLEQNPDGAYTVVRCDYKLSSWHVWGLDYHLQRLVDSFSVLVKNVPESDMIQASDATRLLVQELLQVSQRDIESTLDGKDACDDTVVVVMLTLLWHLDADDDAEIRVKGHVYSSLQPMSLQAQPDPVTVVVALGNSTSPLANRKDHNPAAKLSSWCRQRRPLEDQFYVKHPMFGIDEALLVIDAVDDDGTSDRTKNVELLEGLTSNFFVVSKDGTLQTAGENVLEGYARHLVLNAAPQVRLEAKLAAPVLRFRGDHSVEPLPNWRDCFVTSSVRLIAPVDQVLVRLDDDGRDGDGPQDEFAVIWSRTSMKAGICGQQTDYWRLLYDSVLREQYPAEHN